MLGNGGFTSTWIASKHHVHRWHLIIQSPGCPEVIQFDERSMIQNLLLDHVQSHERLQFADSLFCIRKLNLRKILWHNRTQVNLLRRQILLHDPFRHPWHNLFIKKVLQEIDIPEIGPTQFIGVVQIFL